jgi:hypothetical protein
MAVDYLKTYLGIDPNDYSAMEARIRGEEPQARTPVMMRQPMMMPQQRSLGDIEAMQLIPRQQPAPQVDDRYQGLTDQIVALKSQIEGMQAPQPAPQVDERYQGLMDQIAALRSQIEGMQAPVVEEAPVMAPTPAVVEAPTPAPAVMSEPFQAPPEIENRMVGEPEPFVAQEPVLAPTPALDIPQAPAEDIQASINYLAGLPKMNIPQIPDIEEIKRKMAEANMNFPEPVSYPDQLQAIRDLPPMNQMPTREEIQAAMQNIPAPVPAPRPAPAPAQTIQEKIQAVIQNIPTPIPEAPSIYTSPNNSRKNTSGNPKYANAKTSTSSCESIQLLIPDSFLLQPPQMPTREEIQMAMQNMPTPTAPASSMPKFNLPQMQSFGLPQKIGGGRTLMSDFSPRNVMRMASGGGIDKAIYDLKFKLNGS